MPFVPGAYDADEWDLEQGKFGRLGQGAETMMGRVRGSFEIRDYGLFGWEGDQGGGIAEVEREGLGGASGLLRGSEEGSRA